MHHDQSSFYFLTTLYILTLTVTTSAINGRHERLYQLNRPISNLTPLASNDLHPIKYIIPGSEEENYANEKRIKCINSLKISYRRIVGSLLKGRHAILVDTVDHSNLGDSFIQVGEMILMQEFGTPPKQACSVNKCNFTAIKMEIMENSKESVILVHGGGNLGDFWRSMSLFKNKLIAKFHNHPIVFLPQSVYYARKPLAIQDAVIFRRHKNLTVILRDYYSLRFIRTYFKYTKSLISPDGAFMIGPLNNSQCVPKFDVLVLARVDLERDPMMGKPKDIEEILMSKNVSYRIGDWFDWRMFVGRWRIPMERLDWPMWRLNIAIDMLCLAKLVITDRLHATILATLMGIPHIYLDNRSGKIHAFRESNFGKRKNCQDKYLRGYRAKSWKQAANFALVLMGKKRG